MNLLPMNAFSLASAVPLKLTAFIWLTRAKLLRRLLLRCQEPRDVFGRLECASVLFLFFFFFAIYIGSVLPKGCLWLWGRQSSPIVPIVRCGAECLYSMPDCRHCCRYRLIYGLLLIWKTIVRFDTRACGFGTISQYIKIIMLPTSIKFDTCRQAWEQCMLVSESLN